MPKKDRQLYFEEASSNLSFGLFFLVISGFL